MKQTLTIAQSSIESAQRQAQAACNAEATAAAQRPLGLIHGCRESGYDAVRITR